MLSNIWIFQSSSLEIFFIRWSNIWIFLRCILLMRVPFDDIIFLMQASFWTLPVILSCLLMFLSSFRIEWTKALRYIYWKCFSSCQKYLFIFEIILCMLIIILKLIRCNISNCYSSYVWSISFERTYSYNHKSS